MLNTIKSYAKINLFLNVVDKLDTGFHELNSVLSRIDLYDEIRIKDESSFSISYNGPFGDQVGSNDHISKLFNYLIFSMLCLIIDMHPPGIEPGAPAWKANMLPLHHECFYLIVFLFI